MIDLNGYRQTIAYHRLRLSDEHDKHFVLAASMLDTIASSIECAREFASRAARTYQSRRTAGMSPREARRGGTQFHAAQARVFLAIRRRLTERLDQLLATLEKTP